MTVGPAALGLVPSDLFLSDLRTAAREHGAMEPDLGDIHRFRRNKLLAPPRQVGRGRGPGSFSYYRPADAAIAVEVIRGQSLGLRRWRDLRLLVWLHGHDLPDADIASDLESFAIETVTRINRELRTKQWGIPPRGTIPRRPRYRRLAAELVSHMHPGSLRHRLKGASSEALAAWEPILGQPRFEDALQALAHLMLEGDATAVVKGLAKIAQGLASPLVPPLEVWRPDVVALSAILSAGDQILATAVRAAGPERLDAARFLLREGGSIVEPLVALVISTLRSSDDDDLDQEQREWLASFMEGFLHFARPRDDADRLLLLLTLLVLDQQHPSVDLVHIRSAMGELAQEIQRLQADATFPAGATDAPLAADPGARCTQINSGVAMK